ncbi:unnamed protein product [Pieris macdunnoughi]|uniref:Dual specificity protein phosphatase n=1 Tax=Pieris macdunnoughi TaxID=345717 RepID=A0A821RMA2_9NEOP|nr:unnamed protein product [Pieris macdunnoughi]
MSFLSELKKQKEKLKETSTVVTNVDGKQYLKTGQDIKEINKNAYGFVVDTKPDDIPVLIVDNLYIGSQDCAVDSVLEKYNIVHVLSLGVDVNIKGKNKFIYLLDLPESDVRLVLKESLLFMNEAIEKKENVLVHCNAGVSRTSLVAIAYLMHYENMAFEDSYNLVKSKRPCIRPNDGFVKQLRMMVPGGIL